ncbi:alpha/beta hydrolase family protein [Nocardia sp. JMUB6875]|uniref:alpha/beta hydrolase family protein n=1 Tax=Nocardia sp. JMUB6875 TaxID=3158170 RepID=UPI0034E86403
MASTAAALFTVTTSAAQAGPIGITVLPRPSGEMPVGTTTLHLVDPDRPDPFHPERPRELMVSVFYPASDVEHYLRAHYVSSQLVPELQKQIGVELPGLLTNSYSDAPARIGGFPVVLYTPGAGVTRLLGTGLAEDLASRGYVVVTIDHTYESPAVEFPGGRLAQFTAQPGGFTPELRKRYIDARLPDIGFVLDSLTLLSQGVNPDAEQRALPAGLDHALDLGHIGMVGHSSGGYAAVEALHEDCRIGAAVDLDGQLGVDADFGRAAIEGVDRPVLVLTSQQIEEVGDARPSLDAFFGSGTGWKQQLTLRDSAHYDFTDMPLLIPDAAHAVDRRNLGTIPAARGANLVHAYVAALFDKFLRARTDTPLEHPPTDPELTLLR